MSSVSLFQTNPKPLTHNSSSWSLSSIIVVLGGGLPCTVAVSLAFLSLHQSHGSQGLPVSFCRGIALDCTVRPPPPMATPPPSLHLHGDWLAILIHKVQLLPVAVMGTFMFLCLAEREKCRSEFRLNSHNTTSYSSIKIYFCFTKILAFRKGQWQVVLKIFKPT